MIGSARYANIAPGSRKHAPPSPAGFRWQLVAGEGIRLRLQPRPFCGARRPVKIARQAPLCIGLPAELMPLLPGNASQSAFATEARFKLFIHSCFSYPRSCSSCISCWGAVSLPLTHKCEPESPHSKLGPESRLRLPGIRPLTVWNGL